MTNGADPKDYARTSITQVITLSSGILGVSITFAKNFDTNHVPGLLLWSWILYVVAIMFGLLSLSSLVQITVAGKAVTDRLMNRLWLLEIAAFFVATVFFMIMALQVY